MFKSKRRLISSTVKGRFATKSNRNSAIRPGVALNPCLRRNVLKSSTCSVYTNAIDLQLYIRVRYSVTYSQIAFMKIAFLGKGGSGKSTMATAFVRRMRTQGIKVLAIDADHNMDLSYNLGAAPAIFLGADPDGIKTYVGSERTGSFMQALRMAEERGITFTPWPADEYTRSVSIELEDGLRLITAGPHTDRVRAQEACSHSLAAPLKVYLPLLQIKPGEAVVIDERAGADPVATGILSGVDLAVIVREPTVHSWRVAEQIRRELGLAGIPHVIVGNKIKDLASDIEQAVSSVRAALVPSA